MHIGRLSPFVHLFIRLPVCSFVHFRQPLIRLIGIYRYYFLIMLECYRALIGPQFAIMMTSSNGYTFRVTIPLLCGEFTGHWWIPHTKAGDGELWCFLWSVPWIDGWVSNREAGDLRRHCAHLWRHYYVFANKQTVELTGNIVDVCYNTREWLSFGAYALDLL